jgi:hypothetical protein
MTRIRESATPIRARSTEEARTPQAPQAPQNTQTTQPARPKGFSALSLFNGGGSGTPAASGFGTAPSGASKLSANDLGVIPQDQGNTNACGTTSLANVMTHWGMPRTHDQIDDSIRAFEMFTAPDKLVEYARNNGMRADMKVDANLNDIARMVDQGAPPIVLIDPDQDNNATLHYVTVTGYNRDAQGNISELIIADSAGGNRYAMSAEEFQKQWDNLKLGGVPTGLNNVMITAVPNDGRAVVGGDGQTRNVGEIELPRSSLWSNLKSGLARGVANLLSNVTNVAEDVWNGAKAVGNAVGNAVDTVVGGAKKLWKKIFG